MKKNLIFLALAAMGLASCNGGFKKGAHGLLYNINVDKSGPNIKDGDFLTFNLVAKTDADSIMLNSYDNGTPFRFIAKQQAPGDFLDVLTSLSEGDSATIKVLVDSVYKNRMQLPPTFRGKYITYNLKIEKVIAKGTQTDQVFQGVLANYVKSETDKLKAAEPGKIKKYIADNKMSVTTTPTGLNYVITQPGAGPTPTAGDTVMVNYLGKLVSGKVFETNIKDQAIKTKTYNAMAPYAPIPIVVGQAKVIAGWDQALMLFNKGTKATLVIPSDLAYKEQGNMQAIGPYTPLVFDVEVVNIIHPDPNAPKPAAAPQLIPQLPVKKK